MCLNKGVFMLNVMYYYPDPGYIALVYFSLCQVCGILHCWNYPQLEINVSHIKFLA